MKLESHHPAIWLFPATAERLLPVPTPAVCAAVLRRGNDWVQVLSRIGFLGSLVGGVAGGEWAAVPEDRGRTEISGIPPGGFDGMVYVWSLDWELATEG